MTRLVALNEVERIMKIEEMILKAASGEMAWNRAAEVLGMSPRHLRRLRNRRKFEGLEGLQDRRRAPSPKRIPDEVINEILAYYREECAGYNPTHFHEELLANTEIEVGYTWLKNLLRKHGLISKERKRGKYRQRRERREMTGMMVHLDGSYHRWFGHKKDSKQTLVVAMDDADSRILSAQFVQQESTQSVMKCIYEVVLNYGTFIDLYTDRASHFAFTPKANGKVDPSRPTQFGVALKELKINLIWAYSPQARGRGERLFRTLQDRLVNELRQHKIKTYEAANKYLNEVYIPKHNKRFTVEATSKETAFLPTKFNLKYIFSIRNERKVRKDNTVTLSNQVYQLPKLRRNRTMAGRTIEMRLCLDGSVVAMHGGQVISEWPAPQRDAGIENNEEVNRTFQ